MSVLVTHAHNRLAYYATRCLAKHGIKVTSASEFPLAATFFSRYCSDHFIYPSPWNYPDQFVEKVIEEVKKQDIDVLMPVHSEGYILTKYKENLDRHVKFPYSPYEKISSTHDKKTMYNTATEIEVRTPKTVTPNNMSEVKEVMNDLRFPVLIKPRRGHGGRGISKVDKASQLSDTYLKNIHRLKTSKPTDYPIIQEWIEGRTLQIGMIFNQGRLIAKYSQLSPNEYLTYIDHIEHENQEATESLTRIGKHLNWHGPLSATFILNEENNLPYLTDINPRFCGHLSSAEMSGVNMPYLLYRIATEGDVEPKLEYQRGLRPKCFWRDVERAVRSIQRGKFRPAFQILTNPGKPDFWDPEDPIPFFILPIYNLTQLFSKGTMLPLIEKY
jgi:predicted ATP-grasp superfamily ATP-dependent carboligase